MYHWGPVTHQFMDFHFLSVSSHSFPSKCKYPPRPFSVKRGHCSSEKHIMVRLLDFSSGDSDLRTHQNLWELMYLIKLHHPCSPRPGLSPALSTFFKSWFQHPCHIIAHLWAQLLCEDRDTLGIFLVSLSPILNISSFPHVKTYKTFWN